MYQIYFDFNNINNMGESTVQDIVSGETKEFDQDSGFQQQTRQIENDTKNEENNAIFVLLVILLVLVTLVIAFYFFKRIRKCYKRDQAALTDKKEAGQNASAD